MTLRRFLSTMAICMPQFWRPPCVPTSILDGCEAESSRHSTGIGADETIRWLQGLGTSFGVPWYRVGPARPRPSGFMRTTVKKPQLRKSNVSSGFGRRSSGCSSIGARTRNWPAPGTARQLPVGTNCEWIMQKCRIPREEYREAARQFNPVKFDAEVWADLAATTGMKYVRPDSETSRRIRDVSFARKQVQHCRPHAFRPRSTAGIGRCLSKTGGCDSASTTRTARIGTSPSPTATPGTSISTPKTICLSSKQSTWKPKPSLNLKNC